MHRAVIRSLALTTALAPALGLAGCGDDGSAPAVDSGPGSTAAVGTESTAADESADETGSAPPMADGWLHSDGLRIRDSLDRVVVLRGVNARVEGIFDVTFDDGRRPLESVPPFSAEDATQMRDLGFNVLRLPLNWSGIEPEQGMYDEVYLDRVAEVVSLCADAGLWVILDFHQDAYSKEIGEDGAPLWAIHPPPTELLGGPLGDSLEQRRFSAQVLAAFVGFFDDQDDDDNDVWLQAAFGDMARHVAERFADEPAVLGYELFNEPVASDAQVWSFHDRIVPAIREVDDRHLIIFEPSATRNVIETAPLAPAPFADDQGVYAPHLYTFSFGDASTELAELSEDDLRPNVEAAVAEAQSWQSPLFVGEWGIAPEAVNSDLYVDLMYGLFDEYLLHSTVWLWKEDSQGRWGLFDYDEATEAWALRPQIADLHARPFPAAIAGEPEAFSYDRAAATLTLSVTGNDSEVPTLLSVPLAFADEWTVRCDDEVVATAADRDPATGTVEVACGGAGSHQIVLAPGN